MQKSPAVTAALATALILSSAAPAFAAKANNNTRSFQSLPAVSHIAPVPAASRFAQPAAARGGGNELSRGRGNDGIPGRWDWGNPRRLSVLFGFLPYPVQQAIAEALDNAGPRGDQICRVLGIPDCQLPDSTG